VVTVWKKTNKHNKTPYSHSPSGLRLGSIKLKSCFWCSPIWVNTNCMPC